MLWGPLDHQSGWVRLASGQDVGKRAGTKDRFDRDARRRWFSSPGTQPFARGRATPSMMVKREAPSGLGEA